MFENDKDWAISSEVSLETKINVQRLLKSSKVSQNKSINTKQGGTKNGSKEESKS